MCRSRSRQARRVRAQRVTLLSVLALASAVAAQIGAPAWASTSKSRGRTARVLRVRDEGHLHYVKSAGEVIIDEGHASGSLPGRVKVRFLYNGEPTVAARFTIYTSAGSISARATARVSSVTSRSPSFRGTMTITGGSGRYAHIHGGGELFGVYYRRSYALIVQAIATLHY
jgi:hypothetical protein